MHFFRLTDVNSVTLTCCSTLYQPFTLNLPPKKISVRGKFLVESPEFILFVKDHQ